LEEKIFENPSKLKPLLSKTGWKIFQLLNEKSYYPAEIAKKLNLHEQKVYYYIKQMKKNDLIEVERTEEKFGALAKYFKAKFSVVSLVSGNKKERKDFEVSGTEKKLNRKIEEFFFPFIEKGKFNSKIIVGSPDPHGSFKARARDAFLAVELSAFFGSMAKEIKYPLVFLDTEIESLKNENSNLIVIGGILTNTITKAVNSKLNAQFIPFGGRWIIKSNASKKEYSEDAVGFIEVINHPFYARKKIMVIAGNRNAGTKAAIIALVRHAEEIAENNSFNEKIHSKIVEGIDLDGDGKIDNAEIKE
jgi:DNA-binding CsgD family transcriptional regulator